MPSLVICEKPSVAQDVAKALIGPKAKRVGDHWEGPDAIIAFAVGHLVEQVDPDAYDTRYKKWNYDDLPILPDEFRYHPRDARAGKTLKGLDGARLPARGRGDRLGRLRRREAGGGALVPQALVCLLYTSPSPRD